jgi:3-hydroxybutyryl-CoA dehydrogenase
MTLRSVKDGERAGDAGLGARAAQTIGVVGAGTMGAGIAQLAARSGAVALMCDPLAEALERGLVKAREGLAIEAAKGRLAEQEAQEAASRLHAVEQVSALAQCDLVIEAAPERLDLKHELFATLSEIVAQECVLATNTSSLLVTAVASAASNPERVVGMHFFNPAPVMRLLEVVAGEQSGEPALALAEATGRAMGKTVIRATDGPGFLVNRCNRPFGLEALRLLAERLAGIETIDQVCRMAGGFPMGPFELMDLVGVDTGLEVSKSFYEQSFGEPRWRPSPITVRYVAAGRLGRKSGRGYYDYSGVDAGARGGPYRASDPDPIEAHVGEGEGVIVLSGAGALADELRAAAAQAGYEVRSPHAPSGGVLPSLAIDCSLGAPSGVAAGARERAPLTEVTSTGPGGARLVLCARGSLAALDPAGSAVGFHALTPLGEAQMVELTRSESSSPLAATRAERFFNTLGKHVSWVGDAPGLVLGRIVCQVINEASFALAEGVGSARDIDLGMMLGLSHPRGPLEWADTIGIDHVLAVLGALWEEYREERYRPAPALNRLALAGRLGRGSGGGFFDQAR